MKYLGNHPLTQSVFDDQPPEVSWAGVDFDGTLHFGEAISPRFSWASEQWRGFKPIGEPLPWSGFKPLTQIRKNPNWEG